jgi:hypothetical protein
LNKIVFPVAYPVLSCCMPRIDRPHLPASKDNLTSVRTALEILTERSITIRGYELCSKGHITLNVGEVVHCHLIFQDKALSFITLISSMGGNNE